MGQSIFYSVNLKILINENCKYLFTGFLRKDMHNQKFFGHYGNDLYFRTERYPFVARQYVISNHLNGYLKLNYLGEVGVCSNESKYRIDKNKL